MHFGVENTGIEANKISDFDGAEKLNLIDFFELWVSSSDEISGGKSKFESSTDQETTEYSAIGVAMLGLTDQRIG